MDSLLSLAQPWAYVIVALLAAAESAAFVGLVLPGEAAMVVGGVLVYQERAVLGWMLVAGCLGAIAGDSIGYEIGRHFGQRLMGTKLGRRVGEERWERALAYVRKRGGRAIFLGRFVGVLRALVPAVAGSARIRYRTFIAYNAAGGIVWASGFILLGVVAGGSYRTVQRWAGRATLVLAGAVVVAAAITFAAHWVLEHRDDLRGRRDRFLDRPRIRRVRERYRHQIDFLRRRLDPRAQAGLYLTVAALVATLAAWGLGAIMQDVIGRDGLALIDRPVIRYLALHREPWLTGAMDAITLLGGTLFVVVVLTVLCIGAFVRTRSLRWPAFFAATLVGAVGVDNVIKFLVDRARPRFHPLVHPFGSSFPSGHATAAAVLFGSIAYAVTRRMPPRRAAWIWSGAAVVVFLVGLSRVYLGAHWPTDVVAGFLLGTLWVAAAAAVARIAAPAGQRPFRSASTSSRLHPRGPT